MRYRVIISCDNVLNPADPDASYNKRRGVGYLVQVMETFSDDTDKDDEAEEATSAVSKVAKPDLITHMALGKMTVHDSKALLPALQDTKARGVAPEHMLADTHYGSTKCLAQAKAKGVTLLAPAMPPKGKGQGKLTLEDFDLNACGHIQRCPAGHTPLETSVSKKRLQVRFAIDVCDQCPLQDRCPIKGKDRLQYTHERIKQRARRLSEHSDAFRDRYRWRAGIEGTISRLKHQMGLAHLRVRGQGAVQYRVLLCALGLNIHRVAAWRRSFYSQKLFGRLFYALRCYQRVHGPYKPLSGRMNSRFEASTTRVCRGFLPCFQDFLPTHQLLNIPRLERQSVRNLKIGIHRSFDNTEIDVFSICLLSLLVLRQYRQLINSRRHLIHINLQIRKIIFSIAFVIRCHRARQIAIF